ncbi:MAG: ATP-binding cassette domain-containing protein [Clostridiales bacterium]|nr:ATP-binding cassette domain-containing protein [Clostridiales bacterium]
MIEIKDLKKCYGERTVLDIPYLKIDENETVAFAGANGSGKTTLLRILAGMIKKSDGTVDVPEKILYMPQQSYAFRGNLIKNITIGNSEKEKAGELLTKLELSHLTDKKAASLSGGELQRLSLCRILVRKSDLLLLDEPTSACDARGAELVIKAIKEYKNENGCAVLMSTHSPVLALNSADRLIILNGGRIEADGRPKEVLNNPGTEWAKSFIAGWKTDA